MKKFLNSAFTMAEAILVMTILGIIATIMISTLKPAEFKEKGMQVMAKKVLSELDVATTQILMNNTADGTLCSAYEAGSSNIIDGSMATTSKKLGNLYKSYLTVLRKQPVSSDFQSSILSSFLLKDGAAVSLYYTGAGFCGGHVPVETIYPGETSMVNTFGDSGYIQFDINDNEPPNVWGKDRFRMLLGREGIVYNPPEYEE